MSEELACASSAKQTEKTHTEQVQDRIDNLLTVADRFDHQGGSRALARRARDKAAGMETALRIMAPDSATLAAARGLHQMRLDEGIAGPCYEGDCEHDACHDGGESPTSLFAVCAHCMDLAADEGLYDETWPSWAMWPCATAKVIYSPEPKAGA